MKNDQRHRHRLRGVGDRHLPSGAGQRRDLPGRRRGEDRAAATWRAAHLRAGLKELLERNVQAGRLAFTTDYAEGLRRRGVHLHRRGHADRAGWRGGHALRAGAAARIAEQLDHDAIIVNKSTMPVGSGDLVSARSCQQLGASCGALRGGLESRISARGRRRCGLSCSPTVWCWGQLIAMPLAAWPTLCAAARARSMMTDLYTAEMIKYASNAFLATKISFINEIARICERLGADVKEVAAGMGYDKRIGRAFLDAGLGYGGSCFPKDVKALAHMAAEAGCTPSC